MPEVACRHPNFGLINIYLFKTWVLRLNIQPIVYPILRDHHVNGKSSLNCNFENVFYIHVGCYLIGRNCNVTCEKTLVWRNCSVVAIRDFVKLGVCRG
jgi:hypothetical protein